MKDIEDKLKEKYDEVEVPSYMFDTSRVFKRVEEEKKQRNRKIISIAASVMVILIVVVLLFFVIPKGNNEEYDIKEKTSINEVKGKVTISNETIKKQATQNNKVLVIKCEKCIDSEIINGIPYSKIKAKTLNSYLGKTPEEIELFVPGGTFKVKEIRENIKEVEELNKYEDDDLLQVTYYNEIYIPVPEEGKTYITTIYENNNNYYVNMNTKYGFKEYDPETNIVKDDMGDVELEIDKYLENINI